MNREGPAASPRAGVECAAVDCRLTIHFLALHAGTDPGRVLELCFVPRRPAKQTPVAAEWQITRITGKGALHLGQVQAPDAAAAIRRAIEKFDIAAEHQSRVAARLIMFR